MPADTPEEGIPQIVADRQLISRAIHNLVDNAIKHTPDGGTIRLFAFYEADINAPEIVLGVADTGSGIQESMFPRLFDKFSPYTENNAF